MLVYRIDRKKYLDQILTGNGARLNGARWNHKGTPAIYASTTISLALLEIIVHIKQSKLMPADRIIVTLDIPDKDIATMAEDSLPSNWNQLPDGPLSNRDLFEREVIQKDRIAMRVPSVIIPQEYNIVINPSASIFSKVSVVNSEDLVLDNRI